jgi:hypothetical protein
MVQGAGKVVKGGAQAALSPFDGAAAALSSNAVRDLLQ